MTNPTSVSTSGETYYRFTVEYDYDGSLWETDIYALNHEDAQRKVEALKETARYAGQVMATIEVPRFDGLLWAAVVLLMAVSFLVGFAWNK